MKKKTTNPIYMQTDFGGGKKAIIDGIILSAETAASALIADAQSQSGTLTEKTRVECERIFAEQKRIADLEIQKTVERAGVAADLEQRKEILRSKQELIGETYAAAIKKLLNFNDASYRELITSLVLPHIDDGDGVIVCERDAHRLNGEWIAELRKKSGVTVTLLDERHNYSGGVILRGKHCDKNVTLDTVMAERRVKTESAVAERLFGGDKK